MSRRSFTTKKTLLGVTGGGSCLNATDEGARYLPQAGGIGAELRDDLLNRGLLHTRPEGITALNR